MSLRAGTAFVDLAPRLAAGFEKQVGDEVEGPIKRIASNVGKVLGGALVAGGAAAVAFGVKSSKAFADVGGEVNKLIRYTGGSAEAMSRLRFAAKETGIDTDKMGQSLGILSKHLAANDKAAKAMGISYRDAKGNIKPLDSVMLSLADKFSKMPNGAEKTALAMQLFGKSGADMLPFLNKGSAGLSELSAKAEKFGQVLTQDNLDAIKKNSVAHREFGLAMEGLQVRVGAYVLPILTKLVEFLTGILLPGITVVSDMARKYLAPAFEFAFGILEKVMGSAVDFTTSTLLPGFESVFGALVDLLKPVFNFISNLVSDYLVPGFVRGFGIVKTVVGAVARFVVDVLFPAFDQAFKLILGVLNPFFNRIKDIFDGVKKRIGDSADKAEGPLLRALQKVGDYVKTNLAPILAVGMSGAGLAVVANQALAAGASLAGMASAVAVLPAMAGWIALIVIAIAALVAGVIYAYTHFKTFRDIVDAVGNALKVGFAATMDFLTRVLRVAMDFIMEKVGAVQAYFDRIWPQIEEAVTHVMNVVDFVVRNVMAFITGYITVALNVIGALWRAWGDDLGRIVGFVFNFIKSTIENVLQVVRGIIQFVLAIINGDWGKAWDAIKMIVGAVFKQIGAYVELGINLVKSIIGGVLSTIAQIWNGVWDSIASKVSGAWNAIYGFVSNGIGSIVSKLAGLGSAVTGAISGAFDGIKNAFRSAINAIIRWWNGLSFKVPKIHVPGTNIDVGGQNFSPPNIPLLARGGKFDGLAITGEEGAELISGKGRVSSNRDLATMLHDALAEAEDIIRGNGPLIAIDKAYFDDEVDVDVLFRKAEFAAVGGNF